MPARWTGAARGRSAAAACSTSRRCCRWTICRAHANYARDAVFLASDDAEMITGVDLRVDAGAVGRGKSNLATSISARDCARP